jgi:hypothetical protein
MTRFDLIAKATHVYVGRKPCGCIVAVVVDEPKYPKDTGKDVAAFIRRGYTVERITLEELRGRKIGCKCGKAVANAK